MKKILSWHNYVDHHTFADDGYNYLTIGEVNTLPSCTIPDQALSIKEMLARYVRGQSVETFTPVYTDNEFIPDNLERMDVFERAELAKQLKDATGNARSDSRRAKVATDLTSPSDSDEPVPTE